MKEKMRAHITMSAVAREAGVSQSTVSRVLSDAPAISEATRENVRRALHKLQYHKRKVSGNRIALLMCPFPEQKDPFSLGFFNIMFSGIQEIAAAEKYELLTMTLPAGTRRLPVNLNADTLAGVILVTSPSGELIDNLKAKGLPLVVAAADSLEEPVAADLIINNNLLFGRSACRYMLERGIDNFGIMLERFYPDRLLGITLEMQRRNKTIAPENRMILDSSELADYIKALYHRLSIRPWPRGLIVSHYDVALALKPLLNGHGLAVPKDVEIFTLGYQPEQRDFPMIREFPDELGRKAVQALLLQIRRPGAAPCTYMISSCLANLKTE